MPHRSWLEAPELSRPSEDAVGQRDQQYQLETLVAADSSQSSKGNDGGIGGSQEDHEGDDEVPLLEHPTRRSSFNTKRATAIRDTSRWRRVFPWRRSSIGSQTRTIRLGQRPRDIDVPNAVSNTKYSAWSFLPLTLYNEFSLFFNLYFLLVALSQIVKQLRVGYLSTYIAPLGFVLAISLGKEAVDDLKRRRRDAQANKEPLEVLDPAKLRHASDISACMRDSQAMDLHVGDVVVLRKDQRVPADVVFLQVQPTSSPSETSQHDAFIRTDQLDGETDWKLRMAPPLTQSLSSDELLGVSVEADQPDKRVDIFQGSMSLSDRKVSASLNIDHTAWANTVIASNVVIFALVIYTGRETRQALSTAPSRSKSGLLEYEINNLTKILCALTLLLSLLLVAIRGIEGRPEQAWYVAVTRFLILFSTIVPISLRVNLDMGKSVYASFIEKDKDIAGTVVRTSTIPEELGRIEYLLSDKTGTLTQNDMDLRKIHLGTVSFASDAMDEVRTHVQTGLAAEHKSGLITPKMSCLTSARGRREIGTRVRDLVMTLALCHNVTPSFVAEDQEVAYQASSPDEIAIVKWTEQMGLRLFQRDRKTISLQSVDASQLAVHARILDLFPFTSTSKRMGIILSFGEEEIWFFEKGADVVMRDIVSANDWLDEETGNMAREGLRTLVIGRKQLSPAQYEAFSESYRQSAMSFEARDEKVAGVIRQHLENDLQLLGITGVEDKLQDHVRPSIELLRNAGIKIWMLTGDKVETARCVALSAKLISRNQYVYTITNLSDSVNPASAAQDAFSIIRARADSTALLIDGNSLGYLLEHCRHDFITTAVRLPVVVACRCSPTQKAEVALLIRQMTKRRVACIGDGGNDVSMIQAADVGLGIVGKEGQQASLAADFSLTTFHHLPKLLVWHGRNSYKRSAKLAQFVIHRGLIVSVCQTFYSIATELQPHALYRDWLLVGYATAYTMAPVFSLVLDKDVDEALASLYPELYRELTKGRSLSYRTFFIWVAISIYQGAIIQGCSQILVDRDSPRMVSVSFTVLIINELMMVAIEIVTWHWIMLVTILGTLAVYLASIPFLGDYFDLGYVTRLSFLWRVAAISALSLIPPYSVKLLRRTLKPPSYRKVQGV